MLSATSLKANLLSLENQLESYLNLLVEQDITEAKADPLGFSVENSAEIALLKQEIASLKEQISSFKEFGSNYISAADKGL